MKLIPRQNEQSLIFEEQHAVVETDDDEKEKNKQCLCHCGMSGLMQSG